MKNKISYKLMTGCLLMYSLASCQQSTMITDAAIDGYKGPVKQVVRITYAFSDKDINAQMLIYYPYIKMPGKVVQQINATCYDKNGMLAYLEQQLYDHSKRFMVRNFTQFNNNEGKVYDNQGAITGSAIIKRESGKRNYQQLDLKQQPEWEVTSWLNQELRYDSLIYRKYTNGVSDEPTISLFTYHADGSLKRQRTISGKARESFVWDYNTLQKDSYGNPLVTKRVGRDDVELIEEYHYVYYNTPEEEKKDAAARLLLPDAAYPYTGSYENSGDDTNSTIFLFRNGRFAFSITKWQSNRKCIIMEERGRYQVKDDSLYFEYDRPDSSMFTVFGQYNETVPVGRQHLYFFKPKGKIEEEYRFYSEEKDIANLHFIYTGILKDKVDWHFKEIVQQPQGTLWLTDARFMKRKDSGKGDQQQPEVDNTDFEGLVYGYNMTKDMNEWRILPYRPIDTEEADSRPKTAGIAKDKHILLPPMLELGFRLTTHYAGIDIEALSQPIQAKELYLGKNKYRYIRPDKKYRTAYKVKKLY